MADAMCLHTCWDYIAGNFFESNFDTKEIAAVNCEVGDTNH